MPPAKSQVVEEYAHMWPREVFDYLVDDESGSGNRGILGHGPKKGQGVDLLGKPGVYVLYRDDIPYYIGQANELWKRLWHHAGYPDARYGNFWNYFSAFVIRDQKMRDEIEGILIAAMPTANSAKPKLERAKYPLTVSRMVRRIRKHRANPVHKG
jgi:hypothetical protein